MPQNQAWQFVKDESANRSPLISGVWLERKELTLPTLLLVARRAAVVIGRLTACDHTALKAVIQRARRAKSVRPQEKNSTYSNPNMVDFSIIFEVHILEICSKI
jgi:hypothetical protein